MRFPPYFYFRTVTSNTSPRATGPLFCLVYCGRTDGWIKIPLGTELGVGLGGIVLDGDPAAPPKGAQQIGTVIFVLSDNSTTLNTFKEKLKTHLSDCNTHTIQCRLAMLFSCNFGAIYSCLTYLFLILCCRCATVAV